MAERYCSANFKSGEELDRALVAAMNAECNAERAEKAAIGVQNAVENIPEGSTPLVNDLTTGGVNMALSAEQGKALKAIIDALTAEDLGALTVEELNAALAAVKPSFVTATMTASGWAGNAYSFEGTYPKESYDISIEVAPTATAEQFEAFGGAMICGNAAENVATALGDVPTVDIPIIIKVVAK